MERIIVVKIGTDSIVNCHRLNQPLMDDLARQVACLRLDHGIRTVIVSSGAIASGRVIEPSLSADVTHKQVAAMFGQPELMSTWRSAFRKCGIITGEALLKDDDLVNFRRPLLEALEYGVVVCNGSDATYDPNTEREIISRDNDSLSRAIAQITGANELIMLTRAKGIWGRNKRVIKNIDCIEDLRKIVLFKRTSNGTGGPKSKIDEARKFITDGDKVAYIAGARTEDVILRIARGESVGTKVTLPLQGYLLC